jgi:hypothetical protein
MINSKKIKSKIDVQILFTGINQMTIEGNYQTNSNDKKEK